LQFGRASLVGFAPGSQNGVVELDPAVNSLPTDLSGTVLVGGHPVFAVSPETDRPSLRLTPVGRALFVAKALAGSRIDLERLAETGEVSLDVREGPMHFPIGTYRKTTTAIEYTSSKSARKVERGNP